MAGRWGDRKVRGTALGTALLLCIGLLCADAAHAQARSGLQTGEKAIAPAEKDVWLRRLVGRFTVDGMLEVVYPGYTCAPDTQESVAEDPPPAEAGIPYCTPIKGKSDCIGIGKGPGVQCVLDITWQDLYETVRLPDEPPAPGEPRPAPPGVYNIPGGVAYLSPAMSLYGIDPGNSAISYLLVDNKGLPEGAQGTIAGNRATFKTPCVNAAALLGAMRPPNVPPQPPMQRAQPRSCEKTITIEARPDSELVYMTVAFDINDDTWTRYTISLRRDASAAAAAPATNPAAAKPAGPQSQDSRR